MKMLLFSLLAFISVLPFVTPLTAGAKTCAGQSNLSCNYSSLPPMNHSPVVIGINEGTLASKTSINNRLAIKFKSYAAGTNLHSMPHDAQTRHVNKAGITIPFIYVNSHIVIPVDIGGHTFHFVLDSGAGPTTSSLSMTAAAIAGIKASQTLWGIGVGGQEVRFSQTKVKALSVGGKVVLHDVPFYVVKLPSSDSGSQIDGLIGGVLFDRYTVRIDYVKHELRLTRTGSPVAARRGYAISLEFVGGIPVVVGSLDGMNGKFFIDTGSPGSLGIFSPFAEKHKLYTRYNSLPPVFHGIGISGAIIGRMARAGILKIGGAVLHNPLALISKASKGFYASTGAVGNIGERILRRFYVTFDYARKRMYLEPNVYYGKPMVYGRSGMTCRKNSAGFKVVSISPDGPAFNAGVVVGAVVTSVDGLSVANLSPWKFANKVSYQAPGTKVVLTLTTKNGSRVVTFKLRRLLPVDGKLRSMRSASGHNSAARASPRSRLLRGRLG